VLSVISHRTRPRTLIIVFPRLFRRQLEASERSQPRACGFEHGGGMGCRASCSAETTSVVGDQSPVGSIPGNTVASEKDDQMSETMINYRNLPDPHLFEPFFCTYAWHHRSSMLIYRHRLFFKAI